MKIEYKVNATINSEQFIGLLNTSTLAQRRPIEDPTCIEGMIQNSDLTISAWDEHKLVGIARSLTDFHYACYLSDLAVDKRYQNTGIGKQLQILTKQQLGPRCKLILIASPSADDYYGHIGFEKQARCWVLSPSQNLR